MLFRLLLEGILEILKVFSCLCPCCRKKVVCSHCKEKMTRQDCFKILTIKYYSTLFESKEKTALRNFLHMKGHV